MARLDVTTRELGRAGLAAARLALQNARRQAAAGSHHQSELTHRSAA